MRRRGHAAGGGDAPDDSAAVRIAGISHRYGEVEALHEISLEIPTGELFGFLGPDGVGKSTLLGLIAGARRLQAGRLTVLGNDLGRSGDRRKLRPRVAYMPQGLGQNLYGELSVAENIRFFARIHDVPLDLLRRRSQSLLEATGLATFANRLAGNLSGGMKQKLGLCCALIHRPDLLILDEPTTGIDPLSRVQFWDLLAEMREEREALTIVVATSYMSEAERFDHLAMLDNARVLASGTAADLRSRTETDSLDAAYIRLLPAERRGEEETRERPRPGQSEPTVVEARELTRNFGSFTAVRRVSFEIRRGEVFGFVGPNGSGKTTTMKMVTGLLPASGGEARIHRKKVTAGDVELRRQLGYMAQTYSLYSELTARQNLELHAHLFSLPGDSLGDRVESQLERFDLQRFADSRSGSLPPGARQRLSLAVATIHRPPLLVLDEPTSGVDPVARNLFWRLLLEMSRDYGTTVFISTHYLSEATRCDRIALMNEGRLLATASPADLVADQQADDLEEAFIKLIRSDQQSRTRNGEPKTPPEQQRRVSAARARAEEGESSRPSARARVFSPRRLWALAWRESMQIRRDPFRLFFAFVVPLALLLIFGLGLDIDIENLPFAVLDHDRTPESREYVQHFSASRYFSQRAAAVTDREVDNLFARGKIRLALEIPSEFGKNLLRGRRTEVGVWIDGTMPFRAATARGYVLQTHAVFVRDFALETGARPAALPLRIATRYRFNQSLESKNAFVPGLLAFVLMTVPALLTAVAVVREKEIGSITNFYTTPVSRLEFLLAKQIPYVVISMLNFVILAAVVALVFQILPSGSIAALTAGALLFVIASTGFGLLISSFTRTQISAALATLILTMLPSFQYSGLLSPVSSLQGGSYWFGRLFPATYFLNISVGVFTKGLGFPELAPDFAVLGMSVLLIGTTSILLLDKQAR